MEFDKQVESSGPSRRWHRFPPRFKMYRMWGNPPSRPLFDQAALAIVKNPAWAERYDHPAPVCLNQQWVERPDNPRKITIWEGFDNRLEINDPR